MVYLLRSVTYKYIYITVGATVYPNIFKINYFFSSCFPADDANRNPHVKLVTLEATT